MKIISRIEETMTIKNDDMKKEIEKLTKKVGITFSTKNLTGIDINKVKILILFYKWLNSGKDSVLEELSLLPIPKEFKVLDSPLYRGITISKKGYDSLEKGKSISLKPLPYSSWSISLNTARDFAEAKKYGIVVKYLPSAKDIIFNSRGILKVFQHNIDKQYFGMESEVILDNSKLLEIDPKSVVYFYKE